jgi:Zinc knuckle
MEIDARILRVKELIAKREEIDAELASLFGMTIGSRKLQKCTNCGEPGHTARTCGKHTNEANNTGDMRTPNDAR